MLIRKSIIVVITVLISFIGLSVVNRASAQSTNVGSLQATLDSFFEILASTCSISQTDARKIAEERKLNFGVDVNSTTAAEWFGGCTEQSDGTGQGSVLQTTTLGKVMSFSIALYEEKPSSAIVWFNEQYYAVTGQNQVYADTVIPASNSTPFYRPGPGFALLQPLQGLWAWSRNLAYLAFILLIIVIGFLILFRNRVGGDTPITIFNSIPSIMLSLVLITFSYPISALFVDIITVGTDLVQNVMIAAPGSPGYDYVWNRTEPWDSATGVNIMGSAEYDDADRIDRNKLQPDDPQMSIWQIFNTSGATSCKDANNEEVDCNLAGILPDDVGAGNVLLEVLNGLLGFIQSTGLDNTLVGIVMGFAAFTAGIKLFLTLLNKYIVLTIGVILAPWYFFVAGLPGNTDSRLTDFLKVHLGASLTFIAIYGIFLFLIVFVQAPTTADFKWVPPLLGYNDGILQGNIISGIISYGIYLATPSIPELIDNFLEIPAGNVLAQSVGERFSAGASQAAGYGKTVLGSFFPNVPGLSGGGH